MNCTMQNDNSKIFLKGKKYKKSMLSTHFEKHILLLIELIILLKPILPTRISIPLLKTTLPIRWNEHINKKKIHLNKLLANQFDKTIHNIMYSNRLVLEVPLLFWFS